MQNNLTNITDEKWKKLFDLSIKFRDREYWQWMDEEMIFCVQNPETGEMGYCLVLGKAGELHAFNVYQGSEGLLGLMKMRRGNINHTGLIELQNCLMVAFEDRQDIEKEDYNLIKRLGYKFRGKKQWIQFRDYTPGYYPWFLTAADVYFLTVVLEQALKVLDRAEANPQQFFFKKDKYFSRVPEKRNGKIEWTDKWTSPPLSIYKPSIDLHLTDADRVSLKKLSKKYKHLKSTWVVDYFYANTPVQDHKDERPYFPLVFVCIDQGSEMVLYFNMIENENNLEEKIIEELLRAITSIESIPSKIVVIRDKLFNIIEPVVGCLKISPRKVNRVPVLDEVKNGIMNY